MAERPQWISEVLYHPTIETDEIDGVVSSMKIKELDTERRRFISDLSSFDVSACPGSGKTTLVVAKVLLLSRKWDSKTRGMLLLSHTNVAKDEISKRFQILGEELPSGGRPHYVGTIHAFVNKFLTIPYLLSIGIEQKAVDDDIAIKVRDQLLGQKIFGLRNFLARKHTSLEAIKITDSDLNNPFGESLLGIASVGTDSYSSAAGAVRSSVELGYLRHDEIFVFANRYLELHPEVAAALRRRFPFIMIDEMQDTTTEQAKLLDRIFPHEQQDISIQRIGDQNQAIFGTDHKNGYPQGNQFSIADSFRFDSSIAKLASPLAVYPVEPSGLRGVDLGHNSSAKKNVFIVFHPDKIDRVLPSFAQIVADLVPEEVLLSKKVSALGARHILPDDDIDNPDHFPKTVKHYLPTYLPRSSTATKTHRTFIAYVIHARGNVAETGQLSEGLEHIAGGLIRFINSGLDYGDRITIKQRKYRQLVDLVNSVNAKISEFQETLCLILAATVEPTFGELEVLRQKALTLLTSTTVGLGSTPNAAVFFEPVKSELLATRPKTVAGKPTNVYVLSREDLADISVEVSSIHAAKGETHGATLVLDTFNRTHFVGKLIPWLSGKKTNTTAKTSSSDKKRLHECYVAMTRPTELIAIAAVEKSLGKTSKEIEKSIQNLEVHGWKVLRITA
ncbi:UvrD-helicase domain-containing protein [Glutamicibacter sp. NPDC087831]|uniref:UvrD-helicase domain-containing protein n=1 Tax=Glutamicibacter sp. NPDC087831 TaxID=3363998 RepID=UPI0038256D77